MSVERTAAPQSLCLLSPVPSCGLVALLHQMTAPCLLLPASRADHEQLRAEDVLIDAAVIRVHRQTVCGFAEVRLAFHVLMRWSRVIGVCCGGGECAHGSRLAGQRRSRVDGVAAVAVRMGRVHSGRVAVAARAVMLMLMVGMRRRRL